MKQKEKSFWHWNQPRDCDVNSDAHSDKQKKMREFKFLNSKFIQRVRDKKMVLNDAIDMAMLIETTFIFENSIFNLLHVNNMLIAF